MNAGNGLEEDTILDMGCAGLARGLEGHTEFPGSFTMAQFQMVLKLAINAIIHHALILVICFLELTNKMALMHGLKTEPSRE